jgi:NAD(P)-dependent dehydrogenase (short-subunit alcohol dehydrogenase family)
MTSPNLTPISGLLEGKRCLIVGGTSGIGLAAALHFVEQGARVAIVGFDEAGKEVAATGVACRILADAAVAEEVDRIFAETLAALGGLDVLYHVAGGSGRKFGDGPLHECSEAAWNDTLQLNLTSTFLTNRAAVRCFRAQQRPGAILNMASVLALDPAPTHFDITAYAVAKAGVIALTRQTASRYAHDGIRANVLAPGLVDTPMSQRAVGDSAIQRYLRQKQPLIGGPIRPDDVAGAAAFLCSEHARMITGAVLAVDAGWQVCELPMGE